LSPGLLSTTVLILLFAGLVASIPAAGDAAAGDGRMEDGDGGLKISSAPSPTEVSRGETITWNVTIHNPASKPVKDVFLMVAFDAEVEPVEASIAPAPSSAPSSASIFRFQEVAARSFATLSLVVRVPRPERSFVMSRSITGEGFVSVSEEYSTRKEPYEIRCEVAAWEEGTPGVVRNTSVVSVLGEEGAVVKVQETGSGEYSSREEVRVDEGMRSIEISRDVSAEHRPFALDLLGDGLGNRTSLWSEMIDLRNYIVGDFSRFGRGNATFLDGCYYAKLDRNGTVISSGEGFGRVRQADMIGP